MVLQRPPGFLPPLRASSGAVQSPSLLLSALGRFWLALPPHSREAPCDWACWVIQENPHLRVLNLTTSARFLSPHKVTVTGSRIRLWTSGVTEVGASLVAQLVKNLPAVGETWVQSLG